MDLERRVSKSSSITDKLLKYVDIYNLINEKNVINIDLLNKISNSIINDNTCYSYECINSIKTNIINNLIKEILVNSPQPDIVIIEFLNTLPIKLKC